MNEPLRSGGKSMATGNQPTVICSRCTRSSQPVTKHLPHPAQSFLNAGGWLLVFAGARRVRRGLAENQAAIARRCCGRKSKRKP